MRDVLIRSQSARTEWALWLATRVAVAGARLARAEVAVFVGDTAGRARKEPDPTRMSEPFAVACDAEGRMYGVEYTRGNRLFRVAADGTVYLALRDRFRREILLRVRPGHEDQREHREDPHVPQDKARRGRRSARIAGREPARSAARGSFPRGVRQSGAVRLLLPAALRERRDHSEGARRRGEGGGFQRRLPARCRRDVCRMAWTRASRSGAARKDGLRTARALPRPDQGG